MTGPDIRPPGEIDAAWMTAMLQQAGIDAVVRGLTSKGVGTGQIGDSVRFVLDYERGGEDAPRSVVGKFPAADDTSRATGIMLGNYLREVNFYKTLATKALIHTPKAYMAETNADGGEFVLIMEDLAPAEQGDQLEGVTLDQARLVIGEAAKLHASHWGDERLDELPWVSGSKAGPPSAVTPELVQAMWGGFKARYGERLLPHWAEVGEALAGSFGAVGALHDGPRCLTHNDFRPDNMMFGTAAGGYPVTTLDWQSFAYGAGATDVAYFLAGALPAQVRRDHEDELLRLYHARLTALGVKDYAFADLKRHYGSGAFLLFFTAFVAAMVVEQTPRGDEMFMRMLGGAADHILDHRALEGLG